MALTQGSPLPDVTVTQTSATTAPEYYTGYLSDIAKAGQGQLATAQANPEAMVAGFSDLQKQAFQAAPGALTQYQGTLGTAADAAKAAGTAIGASDIGAFYNPYQKNVIDALREEQSINTMRSTLPALKAAFAGTGGFGGRGYTTQAGQTLADLNRNLLTQEAQLQAAGYDKALQAALQQKQLQTGAAQAGTALGTAQQQAAISGLEEQSKLGGIQQAQEQAVINAPLTTATNVANLIKGYTVPTSTSQTYKGPLPGAYSASPLSQIAGLGTLFAAGAGGTSAASGALDALSKLVGKFTNPKDTSGASLIANTANAGESGYGWKYYSDGTAIDPSGNYYYQGDLVYSQPQAADFVATEE